MQHAIHYNNPDLFISPALEETLSQLSVSRSYDYRSDALPELFQFERSFIYNNRIQQTFSLKPSARENYALIKGLIEFSRGSEILANFDAHAKTVTLDLELTNADNLQKLFAVVDKQFTRELAFRTKLKSIIAFEANYRQKAQLLYNEL